MSIHRLAVISSVLEVDCDLLTLLQIELLAPGTGFIYVQAPWLYGGDQICNVCVGHKPGSTQTTRPEPFGQCACLPACLPAQAYEYRNLPWRSPLEASHPAGRSRQPEARPPSPPSRSSRARLLAGTRKDVARQHVTRDAVVHPRTASTSSRDLDFRCFRV